MGIIDDGSRDCQGNTAVGSCLLASVLHTQSDAPRQYT
jgi:hypothetical protein